MHVDPDAPLSDRRLWAPYSERSGARSSTSLRGSVVYLRRGDP